MKELLEIFLTFVRVGATTFGGGYAMLPVLRREVLEDRHWATEEEIMDWYAIGQCLPGLILVNTALFVGNKKKGLAGGIAAAIASVTPSLIIIIAIAALLESFADNPYVIHAFAGIRVCVCVLVLNSVVTLWKKAIKDRVCIIVFAVVFILSVFTDISPVLFVLLSAAAGIAISVIGGGKNAA